MQLIITTMQGLERVLERELEKLGASEIQVLNRAVSCNGAKDLIYKANLHLRTALRVLVPIHTFKAQNEREFYQGIQGVKWSDLFKINQSFSVHAVVNSQTYRHSRYMALMTKDAIVDQFRDVFGRRPNVSTYDPDLIVNIHINEQNCTVSLDSSGESLHKRGYKVAMHEAPLNEVLAAGLLLQSGFQQFNSFHDPMCGSGTFISEGLMIHTNCPPNFSRDEYAFMKWKDYDQQRWEEIKEDAMNMVKEPSIQFSGSDKITRVMFSAKKNLIQIPHGDNVNIFKSDFLKDEPSTIAEFLVMNPPYDIRLGIDNINQFYADIGTTLKHKYTGTRACIFTGNLEALKKVGLRPSQKLNVLNGSIPSKFHVFDLFEGKRKNQNN